MEIIISSIILVAFVFIALGVQIFFSKKGKFPETEIGHNKRMRELGITCVKCDEKKYWQKAYKPKPLKDLGMELKIDLRAFKVP